MPKFPFPLLRRILVSSIFVLPGCRFTPEAPAPPMPILQKVRWSGGLAAGYSDSLIATGDSLHWGNAFRVHEFAFSDLDSTRLRLFEFAHSYGAYASYQRVSGPDGIVEGHFHDGPVWRFHHDRYTGELTSRLDQAQGDELIENLTVNGESLFLKPKEFESFPLLGRIPHSERVIAEHFLGRDWHGPVFTVAYRCHDDTATAFRAFAQDAKVLDGWLGAWKGQTDSTDGGREIRFHGEDEFHRPLIFWKFSGAVMGFEGCFDTILALEYAEKMKKTAILWPKP